MKILKTDIIYTSEFVIKKSKFITIIKKVSSKSDVETIIKENSNSDARHNCWAYVFNEDGIIRESFHNDGEPLGTSGDAMLKTLKSMSLTNIIVFVIRYFGGTKLGVGPLGRSYTQGIKTIINDNDLLKDLEFGIQLTFSFNVSDIKRIDSVIKNGFSEISRWYENDLVWIKTITKDNKNLTSIVGLINITEENKILF
ncbi:YigZ family protein [Spiroplasma endosymbiont of Othius punctulatus]|uniref:IMPACT family protein n=1 Tax=Spiroplasma endosymbiont of Othius punctulatus TaxID=3066289 RepID=UPI0030D17306